MTYAVLMAQMDVGGPNGGVLAAAASLAETFGAGVLGVAVCQPTPAGSHAGLALADQVREDRLKLALAMRRAETEFRAALEPRVDRLEWQFAEILGAVADEIASRARSADLIISSADPGADALGAWGTVDLADLAVAAGRPVLIAPGGLTELNLDHVLIAWTETRVCRRAALSALPMLRKAGMVTVVEVSARESPASVSARLGDVVSWLRRHGVMAKALASAPSPGRTQAGALAALIQSEDPDVIVAGLYGHSPFKEWALGGVSRDVLLSGRRCALVSH